MHLNFPLLVLFLQWQTFSLYPKMVPPNEAQFRVILPPGWGHFCLTPPFLSPGQFITAEMYAAVQWRSPLVDTPISPRLPFLCGAPPQPGNLHCILKAVGPGDSMLVLPPSSPLLHDENCKSVPPFARSVPRCRSSPFLTDELIDGKGGMGRRELQ